jgi:oligopeptide transport system substrate-binding protein
MADGERGLTRRLLLGASGAVVVAGTAAFALRGSGEGRRSVSDGNTFNRGNGAEPDTLDPHLASTQYEINILGDMFLGLMTEDAAANAVPGAALSYAASDDGLVYTFKLRDHKWSDGVPVTAHDYVFSIRRVLNPKTAAQYASILYPIRNAEAVNGGKLPLEQVGVRALDDNTLEIAFDVQVPYIAQLATHISTFAVPRHVVERHGAAWVMPENIVTNGAYVLREWVPNDHILLVKNPHFYDAANVKIENVYYYPTQDFAAALKRFRGGELDMQNGAPSQGILWMKANLPESLHVSPYILSQYVQFNVTQPPFNDVRVRTALSLAIDRETIAGKVMHAGEKAAYAFVPPYMPSYPSGAQISFRNMPMGARIEKAKALLHAAGYGPGNPLSFDYNIEDQTDSRLISIAMQSMWKTVGAEVRIVPSDAKNHYNLMRRQVFSAAWAGWVADYRDARDYLFLCQTASKDLNFGGYSSAKFDSLIAQSDRMRDPAQRGLLLQAAEQTMLDDVALAPVYFGVSRDLVSPAVRGWINNPVDINRSRYLSLDRSRALA